MQKSSVSKINCGLIGAALISIFSSPSAKAVNSTWGAAPTTADWATGANWVSGTVAGAVGTTNNTDTATFLTTNANGTTTPVVIDSGRNVRNISFGSGTVFPSAFTIGTTTGPSLQLTSGGAISFIGGSTGTNTTITINAPLVLEGATATTAGTYSFSNAHSTASNNLVIGGTVSGGTTTAGVTLVLTGANLGVNEVSGVIADGGAAGGLGISKTSSGLWILSGANTYTGGTTLSAGTVSVGTTGNLGSAGSGVTFSGGSLQVTGNTLTSISGLGHTVNFTAGQNVGLDINSAANVFTLDQALNATSSVTKAGAGTLIINQATNYSGSTSATAGTLRLSSANSSAGITTINGATLQLNNAANGGLSSGLLTLGSAAVQSLLANQSVSNAVLINGTDTISGTNALTFTGSTTITGANRTLSTTIGNGQNLTFAGNVYLSELVGSGRTLTLGGSGNIVLSGTIANFNGAAGTAGGLTLSTTGTTTISAVNTYTGATTLSAGTVNLTGVIGSGGGSAISVGTGVTLLATGVNSITGTSSLTLGLGSTVTLTQANNFTGTIGFGNNSANLLTLTDANAIASASSAAVSAGTIRLLSNTSGTTTFTNPNITFTAVTIDVGNNGSGTGNTIALSSGVTAASNGRTVTITGSNGYALALPSFTLASATNASDTLNPTTASVTVSTIINPTANTTGTNTVFLAGSATGNSVTGAITNSTGGAVTAVATNGLTGVWTLAGANTYTGMTTVTAGTLLVNGTHTGGGAYSLTGGKLGGNGSITAASLTASAGAKLSPGGDGVLGHNLTFALVGGMNISGASNNTGAYLFDLGSVSTSDKITLTTGTLNVGTLDFSDFTFTALAGFGGGTYVLFDAASAITGTIGTASGLINGATATLSIDSVNNDVLLTVSGVPEPQTWAMFLIGGFGLVIYARRARSLQRR